MIRIDMSEYPSPKLCSLCVESSPSCLALVVNAWLQATPNGSVCHTTLVSYLRPWLREKHNGSSITCFITTWSVLTACTHFDLSHLAHTLAALSTALAKSCWLARAHVNLLGLCGKEAGDTYSLTISTRRPRQASWPPCAPSPNSLIFL